MPDFQQTVDLREEMERQRRAVTRKVVMPLEKIYRREAESETEADLKTISRPKAKPNREGLIRLVVLVLAILAVAVAVYFLFFRTKNAAPSPKAKDWYAVKLVDGEIFYGQIEDTKADPVVMANIYYNYDQAKAKDGSKLAEETGNLRLVKRGKETHGPAGNMDLVRMQVLFMEPLKSDSKVLKAILEYEK